MRGAFRAFKCAPNVQRLPENAWDKRGSENGGVLCVVLVACSLPASAHFMF